MSEEDLQSLQSTTESTSSYGELLSHVKQVRGLAIVPGEG